MTDDHSPLDPAQSPRPTGPLDDEVVSAVLDGEATPGERALVEGSVEGRARLAELRRVADAAAEPVVPLPSVTVEVLLGRALEAASTPTAAPVALSAHRARRARGASWRRVGTAVAAVAAVLVMVAGVAALVNRSGRGSSSSDSASSATAADGASVSSTTIASGADSARAASGVVPPDLGSLPDAAVVLDRYALLTDLDPTVDHQFELGSATGSGSATAESSNQAPTADAAALSPTACPVPPVAVAPGERWTVTATAQLPEGPVVVMGNGLASPANRLLVVDAATCAVLDERTL